MTGDFKNHFITKKKKLGNKSFTGMMLVFPKMWSSYTFWKNRGKQYNCFMWAIEHLFWREV